MTRPIKDLPATTYRSTSTLAEPTLERRLKAADFGRKLVDNREVRKLKTTADLLEDRNGVRHLPRHLRQALDRFCEAKIVSMNVDARDDGAKSSHRLIVNYDGEPMGTSGCPGSHDVPDHVLNARYLWKMLEREVPREMMEVLDQLIAEEMGDLQQRPPSLQKYGRTFGWDQDKQAVAAGSMLAISACSVLHHALKRGIGQLRGGTCPQCRQVRREPSKTQH